MPSTLVHVAFAGLLGAALLGRAFDRRAVLVILVVGAVADLDAFVPGAHRAIGHTILIPFVATGLLYADTRGRDRFDLGGSSRIRRRWGAWGVRVAWVSVVVFTLAGIGLDLVMGGQYGGVNLLYPLHDQFYRFDGHAFYSTTRGFVQTFVEVGTGGAVDVGQRGSSEQVHIASPADPSPGPEPANVERVFPIVAAGWQLLVVLTSAVVLGTRLRLEAREGHREDGRSQP